MGVERADREVRGGYERAGRGERDGEKLRVMVEGESSVSERCQVWRKKICVV